MNYEEEIQFLAAETLALQTILAHVLFHVARLDIDVREAIEPGFDNAASDAESMAIKLGKAASPNHVVKALGVIEQLRIAALGKPDKPKHAV